MLVQLSLIAVSLLLLAEVWRSHRRLRTAVLTRRRRSRLTSYPSLSVIRPIRGYDVGAWDNIQAALDNGYPGEVETLFVFDDEKEPVLPLARKAIAIHEANGGPGSAQILFCGAPPPDMTGKLNAMISGMCTARGDLIVFADSDIRPDRDALTALVETLVTTPGAGAAFAPVVATRETRTFGDVGYALLINGLYGPVAANLEARNDGELPFIMGQFMVWKRSAIHAIGGLKSARGQIVDDMYLGARVRAEGLRNIVSPRPVPIIHEDLSLHEFSGIYRRWIIFSRTGLPSWSFKLHSWLRGITFWAGLVIAIAGAVVSSWSVALIALLVPLAVTASINSLHETLGGARLKWKHRWVGFALLATAPLFMISFFSRNQVSWRGREYELGSDARLAHGNAIPADQRISLNDHSSDHAA
jgi:ceramide glucosyltransferase